MNVSTTKHTSNSEKQEQRLDQRVSPPHTTLFFSPTAHTHRTPLIQHTITTHFTCYFTCLLLHLYELSVWKTKIY